VALSTLAERSAEAACGESSGDHGLRRQSGLRRHSGLCHPPLAPLQLGGGGDGASEEVAVNGVLASSAASSEAGPLRRLRRAAASAASEPPEPPQKMAEQTAEQAVKRVQRRVRKMLAEGRLREEATRPRPIDALGQRMRLDSAATSGLSRRAQWL